MLVLKIESCQDSGMWYRGLIGKYVPVIRFLPDCYISREPEGYSNIVKISDAMIETVDDSFNEFY
jgi:hypothetical protein